MMRYFETFFRHKILLCAPVVIALVLGVGFQLKQPPKYQSTARMWLDSPLPSASSVDQPNPNSPPSGQHQSLLTELLATRDFDLKVASRIKEVAPPGTRPQSDDEVMRTLARSVSTSTPGPQVLALDFTAPSQGLVVATAKAVVDEFTKQVTGTRSSRGAAVADYYKTRYDGAKKALKDATDNLTTYNAAHPAVAGQPADTAATGFAQAVAVAQQQFSMIEDNLNKANLDLTRVADTSVLHVIDPPSVPSGPVGGKKRIILVGIGAGFAGSLVSVIVMIWLTVADSSVRRKEDVELKLGLGVVGVVQPFSTPRRRAKAHGSA